MNIDTSSQGLQQPLRITIDQQAFEVHDPVLTGRQILDLAGKRPASDFVVLLFLPDGLLEEIRLEETVEVRARGIERFLTFKSDRIFRFIVDEREFVWGDQFITGGQLKELAQVSRGDYEVWQEIPRGEDRRIGNDEKADLGEKNTERFFTAKKKTTEG